MIFIANFSLIDVLTTAASVIDGGRGGPMPDIEKLAGSCFLKTAALFAKLQHFARMRSPTNHVTLRAADAHNKRQ
jgi:hypothetical protein